jgi:hypothetical protein
LFYFIKNTSNKTQYFSVNPSEDDMDGFLTNDSRIVFDSQSERLAKIWGSSPEELRRNLEGREESTMNVAFPPGVTLPGELNIKIVGRSTGTIQTNIIFAPWIYVDADTSSFSSFEPKRPENARRKQLGYYQSNDFEIHVVP